MGYFGGHSDRQRGYILPATIMLGLGIAILSITLLQTTATSSQTLNNQSYQDVAQEAANAGTAYVNSCVQAGTSTWAAALGPQTKCDGTGNTGSSYVYKQGAEWQSTFSVAANPTISNGILTAVSTGKVQILSGASIVKTYTATAKVTLPSTTTVLPVASGQVITDIKNDQTDCAIANGLLYCWGDNSTGQLGRGYTGNSPPGGQPSIGTPTVVAGALAGKTVTKVSVAYGSVCAIADGTPYCWGGDLFNELGDNGILTTNIPKADTPQTSSGPLSGQFTVDIGIASQNNPANGIWPFATAFPHSCALTANGSVSCWGDGGFRQNTGGGCKIVLFVCSGFYNYPSYSTPTLILGYSDNSAPLAGKKSEHIGASSHDSCAYVQGKLICWGVQAPIPIICNSVLFSEAYETVVPFNGCVASYSSGYDTHAISGSDLNGKFIDTNLWDISANEGCFMANTDFICFGTTPAFGLFWLSSWGAPWTAINNADVTDADNGDDIPSSGISGLFCIIDSGVAKCAGQPLSIYTGTGTLGGYKDFEPLVTSSGLSGLAPTKIAAGQDHGCVVANGQLLCWGNGVGGVLGDSNTGLHIVPYATVSGASSVGTTAGYAASGPISVGTSFSCGVVNGNVYCWGKNDIGQLGTGSTTPSTLLQPQAVASLLGSTVTKVSAGGSNACAISYGKLYCWGSNSNGQLGSTADSSPHATPVLIGGNLSGKRVTDVSVGTNSICAIANAQTYCWGDNTRGQLGNGSSGATSVTSPTAITVVTSASGKVATNITMGTNHACVIANADAYCWGDNTKGQLGTGSTSASPVTNPTLVNKGAAATPTGPNGTLPMVSEISAGNYYTCGIFNGTVSCWGDNTSGQLGLGNTTAVSSPTDIVNTAGGLAAGSFYATSISAGQSNTCAVLNGNSSATNGNLYCWGAATSSGTGSASTRPVLINSGTISGKSTLNVSVGYDSACSVSNGDILCWGNGASGQIGNSGTASVATPTITSSYIQLGSYTKGVVY